MDRPGAFSKVLAYARLPHAVPILVVMAATAVMIAILGDDVSPHRWLAILLAMLGAQVALGVVNELADIESDRETKPDKPLASGVISVSGAYLMLVAGLVVMASAGLTLGPAAFALCALGCGVGVAYSFWFKRTELAWVPYLIALPLLPIWVSTSLGRFDARLLWLYPLGACAVVSVQIAQAVPDVVPDRAAGIVSVTTRLGETRSLVVCWTALGLSTLLVVLAGNGERILSISAMLVGAAIVANAGLAVVYRRAGVMAAFPVAAASTALLGAVWVYAVRT